MFDKFLKKSWNPLFFRIMGLLTFLFILLVLYLGSIKIIFNFDQNLMMLLLWILWWPFLYVTLIFIGRAWCGFICPMGLVNEFGNYLGNPKKNFLAKYSFIGFILFFIIVLWEQISGLFSSVDITFFFISVFLLSAFIIGMVIPRLGFCKYFCPIGMLLGVFNRLSIIGVRTNKSICDQCETKECIRGGKVKPCPMYNYVPNLQTNKDCLICTNCIKNCPYNSAKLCFVKPGKEVEKKAGFNLAESFFIVALLGFAAILTSNGTQLVRIFNISAGFVRIFDFAFSIGFFLLAYLIITLIHSKIYKTNFKENLVDGGYVFLPLMFSLMFFLIVFGFITPLTKISELWIAISKYIILLVGTIWSLKIARVLFKGESFIYILSIFSISLLWALVLISGPLNILNNEVEIYYANNGETINMKAFSMGFDPEVIKIKQGDSFKINIDNFDIVHSFDLDELNLHINLEAGENKLVSIPSLEKGEYEYYCAIPGHKEAGMKGMLIVE